MTGTHHTSRLKAGVSADGVQFSDAHISFYSLNTGLTLQDVLEANTSRLMLHHTVDIFNIQPRQPSFPNLNQELCVA